MYIVVKAFVIIEPCETHSSLSNGETHSRTRIVATHGLVSIFILRLSREFQILPWKMWIKAYFPIPPLGATVWCQTTKCIQLVACLSTAKTHNTVPFNLAIMLNYATTTTTIIAVLLLKTLHIPKIFWENTVCTWRSPRQKRNPLNATYGQFVLYYCVWKILGMGSIKDNFIT